MTIPAVYQIRVKEHLGEEWAAWFAPLVIHNEPNGEATFTGPVRDQAELFGLLIKLHELNLTLLAVQRVTATTSALVIVGGQQSHEIERDDEKGR